MTFEGYRRHLRAQKAPAPRSMAEEEKEEIRRAEVTTATARQHLTRTGPGGKMPSCLAELCIK